MKKIFLLSLVLVSLMFVLTGCGSDSETNNFDNEQVQQQEEIQPPQQEFSLSGKEFVCDYSQNSMGYEMKLVIYYSENNALRIESSMAGQPQQDMIITSKGTYQKATDDMKSQTGCDWILWEEQDGVVSFDMDMYERKDLDEYKFNQYCEFKNLDDSLFEPSGKVCTMEELIDQSYNQ